MRLGKYNKSLGWLSLLAGTVLLSGCNSALLDPKEQIGLGQRPLILTTLGLMLIIVIPVISMAVDFVWKYRASSRGTKYSPNWPHSNKVKAVVWTVPILIITFLTVLTWKTTHTFESSKPLTHDEKPIIIEVVSMDWKWLFTCPERDIVTVNETASPANTPAYFKVISNSMIDSLFAPRLSGQIYVVTGMQARLRLVASEPGTYDGASASYSSPGFSGMKLKAIATPDRAIFDQWVVKAKQSLNIVSDMVAFERLTTPSEYNQVEYFSSMRPDSSAGVINKFMAHGRSMDMTQSEGEHGVHEGMEGTGMSHAESVH